MSPLVPTGCACGQRGIALLSVLVALTLLLLLALPFSVSMSRGADAAAHAVEQRQVELLSASARDLMLAEVALGDPTYDPTPNCDDRSEFPGAVPEAFPALRQDGRARFGGETWDLQRFIALDAITPLLLCNLIETTAHLTAELAPDATELALDAAASLPESGFVWVDHEVVHYAGKRGNTLTDCERGVFADLGFLKPIDHTVAETALVLDWRCVLAASWPFDGRTGGARNERQPFAAVGELAEIEQAGTGGFTLLELDRFQSALAPYTDVVTAPQWGRPERVFYDVVPPSRTLTVKSSLHLGAGSTVRLRNLATGVVEYGLVMSTLTPRGPQELRLPSIYQLDLLQPVTQEFPALDTVVEPLVPAPVNANTAAADVLAALFTGCRRGVDVRVHDSGSPPGTAPMAPFSARDARALADEIVQLRGEEPGPFAGFEEFATRLWKPRLQDAGQEEKLRWLYLYRMLLTGRDSVVEMCTAPITFRSGPLVGYRAAAVLQRSKAAPAIAARHERTGTAVALPGLLLTAPWRTQEELEEAFRLDRRAPFWLTSPINTGSVGGGELGNDPISRYLAHIVAMAFPDVGLGESRFPSRDPTDAAIAPGPVSVVPGEWPLGPGANGRARRGHEAFSVAADPRGHDIQKDGPFLLRNTGPRDVGPAAAPARTHELTHPFTTALAKGGAGRFGISAWFEPEALGDSVLLDYSDGNEDRNRMALLVRDGNLVYEVLDEAGLDPDPSQSPAGVARAAVQWTLPLGELALPPRTPVHVAVSAYGSRPGDLSVAVDGVARGETRYRTRLVSALPGYDPSQRPPGPPGQASNDRRYLRVMVESTDGFPPQGVLRIGLELFEYVAINGNSFVCVFSDSNGGRGARQRGREHRPDIPLDGNGKPTIDIEELGAQGVSLDQFPDHPVGAGVELYGYSALPSADSLMFLGETQCDGIGGFAVARGWLTNGRPITLPLANGNSLPIGQGLDPTWTGDLELVDPLPGGRPAAAQEAIANAFATGGGYALLVQYGGKFDPAAGTVGTTVYIGGVELVRYQGRQGNKLTGIQRAVPLPGDNGQIGAEYYDATPHNFVTDWNDNFVDSNGTKFDDAPLYILNVVPVSLTVGSTRDLPDPAITGTSEWVQLYPRGGDPADTEWVRYDAIAESRFLVRANRARWDRLRFVLTHQTQINQVTVGPLGPTSTNAIDLNAPWGSVTPTSGYIGYVPRLEADFPQIAAARDALAFRGDTFTGTSSHPQPSSSVLPCHRLELNWGNYGALTGRPGRNDRVALIAGSASTGTSRPPVEWHTVNWSARQYTGDLQRQQTPPELTGPDPFQLVAFQEPVRLLIRGQARNTNTQLLDVRILDRLVKFPSGELPAASCEAVVCGASTNGGGVLQGLVDEIDVVDQIAADIVVDEGFSDSAQSFLVRPTGQMQPQGLVFPGADQTLDFPPGGGLLQIDGEILAYQAQQDGAFTIARNGRGLLNTEPHGHDRGARVHFLTHRPAAILGEQVGARSEKLPLQALGAMPPQFGTVLLNRTEMLHYSWTRTSGDVTTLEMPRQFPPGEEGDGTSQKGLLRGRYGTTPVAASSGEPVILMPFRYWDRYVPRSDDPESSYFQFTTRAAPVYFRTLGWDQETTDSNVAVHCMVRADARTPWTDEPGRTPFLRMLDRRPGDQAAKVLDLQATQLELRFVVEYRTGCLDLVTFTAHGWKTAPRVRAVELEYEGEGRILAERVTAR